MTDCKVFLNKKDFAINSEIEKLRLSATSQLLSRHNDIVIVSSVSCLYGIGNPEDFKKNTIPLAVGQNILRDDFLRSLVVANYSRNEIDLNRGNFRVKGDTVDIFPAYADFILRVIFWDNDIDSLETLDPTTGQTIEVFDSFSLYPATIFTTTQERVTRVGARRWA